MADYDLGKAHGEIIIENDRKATDQAMKAFRAMRDDLKKLNDQIGRLDDTLNRHAKNLSEVGEQTARVADNTRDMGRAHRSSIRDIQAVSLALKTVSVASKRAAKTSGDIAYAFADVGKSMIGLRGATLKSEDLMQNFAKLAFWINDVHTKLRPFINTIQTTRSTLANLQTWTAQARVELSKFGKTLQHVEAIESKGAAAQLQRAKAQRAHVDATRRSVAEVRYVSNNLANNFVKFGVGLATSLDKLGLKIGRVKKAMSELTDGQREILRYATLVTSLATVFEFLRSKILGAVSAMTALARSAWAKAIPQIAAAIEAVRARTIALAGAIQNRLAAAFAALPTVVGSALSSVGVRLAALGGLFGGLAGRARGLGAGMVAGLTGVIQNSPRAQAAIARVAGQMGIAQDKINRARKALGDFGGAANGTAQGVIKLMTGIALIKYSLKGLKRILNLAALGFQAMNIAAMGLYAIGTAVMTLANGLKQLSGIIVGIPGALAALVTVGAVAAVGVRGLAKAFTAAKGDAEKFEEEIAGLPKELQNFARAAKDLKEPLKEIGDTIQNEMFRGLGDQVKRLSKAYLPGLKAGTQSVARELNAVFSGLEAHFGNTESINQFNRLFTASSQIVRNLATAVRPVLDGFRELGTHGAEALAKLTQNAGNLGSAFSNWAANFSDSGKMEEMIRKSIEGFGHLGRAIVDVGGIVGDFFSHLGISGANGLERMAAAADRWRKKANQAFEGGAIERFMAHFRKMTEYTSMALKRVADMIKGVMERSGDQIRNMTEAINQGFLIGLEKAIRAITLFIEILAHIPGIAQILAIATAFSALATITNKAVSGIAKIVGVFMGAKNTFMGITQTVGNYTRAIRISEGGTTKLGQAFQKLGITGRGVQIAFMGIAAAAVAAFAAYTMLKALSEKQTATANRTKEANEELAKSYDKVSKAVIAANGLMSEEVKGGIEESMEGLGKKYDTEADQILTGLDKVSGGMKAFWERANNTDQTRMQHQMGKWAKEAGDSWKQFISSVNTADLVAAVHEGGAALKPFTDQLQQTGEGGKRAASDLYFLSQKIQFAKEIVENSPPGFIELSNAMGVLRDKSSSAADKLGAVDAALRAMGLLKSDQVEVMIRAGEAVDQLAEKMAGLSRTDAQGDEFFLNGQLNGLNQSVSDITPILKTFYQTLKETAQNGGDMSEAWGRISPQLDALKAKLQMTDQEFQTVLNTFGLFPDQISMLLSLEGVSQATSELVAMSAYIQAMPAGKEMKFYVDSEEAANRIKNIDGLLVQVHKWGDKQIVTVKIDPKADPGALNAGIDKLLKELQAKNPQLKIPVLAEMSPEAAAKYKKQVADAQKEAQKTGKPIELPIPQQPQQQQGNKGQQAPGDKAPEPGKPGEQKVTVKVEGQEKIDALKTKVNELQPKSVKIGITNADVALGAVQGVKNALSSMAGKTVKLGVSNADVALGAVQGVKNALDALPAVKSVRLSVQNADVALGAIQGVVNGLSEFGVAAENAAKTAEGAMARIKAAIETAKGAINSVGQTMQTVATSAFSKGAALGQGFADGIKSKTQAVNEAANALANAASRPLPRSPAKEGPFSGRGWTPYRGRALAEGFAKGIHSGAATVNSAALDVAKITSAALDKVTSLISGVDTGYWENRAPGASGKMFYRDPTISDQDLAEKRQAQIKEDQQKQADEDFRAAKKGGKALGKQREALTKAQQALAKAQERYNKATTQKQRESAQNAINSANDRILKAQQTLDKTNEAIRNNPDAAQLGANSNRSTTDPSAVGGAGTSYSGDSSKIDSFVRSLDHAQYGMGQFNEAMIDCSGFVSAVANAATGRGAFSERTDTTRMREYLKARGFIEGKGGQGDLSVAWWDRGGGANGHTALTTPSGLNAESTTGGVRFGQGSAGARSNNSQFTDFMYLPGGGNSDLSQIASGMGANNEDQQEALALARQQNKKLDQAIKALDDPNSSRGQNIRAMQDIADAIATTRDPDLREPLKNMLSRGMEIKGYKEEDLKDPKKSKDPFMDAIGVAQNVVSLYNSIKDGLKNGWEAFGMLARGFENTADIDRFVDAIQNISQTIANIMTTVATIMENAATIAALASLAIPGIGPIVSAVTMIAGKISDVNAIIDLAQDVYHIGARYVGTVLSWLAGGANGPLQGDVKALLDTNDQTLKTWSSDNALDKSVFNLDPFGIFPDRPAGENGSGNQFNIYANPNAPASEIVNELGYALRTNGDGAYQE